LSTDSFGGTNTYGSFSTGFDFGAINKGTTAGKELYESLQHAFTISVDGSDDQTIDLSYLVDEGRMLNGQEMATELTNLLQRQFGNRSVFSNSGGAPTTFTITQTDLAGTNAINYDIDVTNLFDDGATPTIEELIDGIKAQLNSKEGDMITFTDLTSGQTVTVNGLTFTAGSSGATAEQIASAFSNLSGTTAYTALSSITNTTHGGTFTAGAWATGWTTPVYTPGDNSINATSTSTGEVTDISVSTSYIPTVAETQIAEQNTITFSALTAGQTVIVNGLTYTSTGATTAAQVAAAFTSLTTSSTAAGSLTNPSTGTFSGTWAGNWSTAAGSSSGEIIATYVTAGVDATNLSNTGTGTATVAVTREAKEQDTVTFRELSAGQSVTLGGLTFTAGSSGATAAQVATAFASLANGATTGGGTANGTYSGTFTSDWTTGTASGETVVATYDTAGTNASNIAVSSITASEINSTVYAGPALDVKYDYATQRLSIKIQDTTTARNSLLSLSSDIGNIFNIPTTATQLNSKGELDNFNLIPNGASLQTTDQQRYGMQVIYEPYPSNIFKFQSGTTGDTSSLSINLTQVDNEDDPNMVDMFGLHSDTGSVDTSDVALRGITSDPAIAYGATANVFTSNSFTVDETNNKFLVTVDGIQGTVILPTGTTYTLETFIQNLQKGINSLTANNEDNLDGQIEGTTPATVNGVVVAYDALKSRLTFTTGTTGDNAYIRVSGDSYWGLDNVAAARGSVSSWIKPTQHKIEVNGSLQGLYIDKNGNETTSPDGFTTLPEWSPVFLQKGQLTFDTGGKLVSPIEGTQLQTVYLAGGKGALTININYAGSTQYQSSFAVLSQSQDGAPEGDLVGVTIGNDGLVSASFSNGTQKSLAKILLVNFSSPSGLRQIGDSSFLASSASGKPQLGNAGSAGFGTLRAGATERSNVDLTNELVDLITAQRNFQANAKAIETSSTMTSAIINLRS
jgi:flagellar hook-basal body protein